MPVDRKSGGEAERGRIVLSLRSGNDDARELRSVQARRRVAHQQATTPPGAARRAGPADGADGLACLSDIGREAVPSAAMGDGGGAGDAVGDDELKTRNHRVLAEDDLEMMKKEIGGEVRAKSQCDKKQSKTKRQRNFREIQ